MLKVKVVSVLTELKIFVFYIFAAAATKGGVGCVFRGELLLRHSEFSNEVFSTSNCTRTSVDPFEARNHQTSVLVFHWWLELIVIDTENNLRLGTLVLG